MFVKECKFAATSLQAEIRETAPKLAQSADYVVVQMNADL